MRRLTSQDVENFFEFLPELTHYLLAHARIGFDLFSRKLLPGSAYGEPVLIEEAADLADEDYVLTGARRRSLP